MTATPNSPPSPPPGRLPHSGGTRTALRVLFGVGGLLALVAVLLLAGRALGLVNFFGSGPRPDLIIHKVHYEPLQLTITERGQLESADNSDIVCRVKARSPSSTVATSIRWVIDDGTQVKRGDKLVQLDDSGLTEQLKQQKIAVDQARANWVAADKQYEIVESQNKSDKATAKLALELAEIDLKKFEQGEFVQQKQEVEGKLMIARSDLAMWEERAAWSARMSKPGRRYVTAAQAQADEARLKSAEIAMKRVEEEQRVLLKYTSERTLKDLKGKIEEAKRAQERVEAQARAKEVTADSDRRAKRSIYEQELARFHDIEDEIRKCLILAPQSGLVVYHVDERSRFGSGSQQSMIAQGEPVREGQKLMRIPDLTKMIVNTRVHEAMISRVRGEKWRKTGFSEGIHASAMVNLNPFAALANFHAFNSVREEFSEHHRHLDQRKIDDGQPAEVRIDAFPGKVLPAEIKSVATVASQQDWYAADVKVYQTLVTIKESVPGLKPGMTAEVTIRTDSHRESCLTVPVQAIVGSVEMGGTRRVYVMTPAGPQQVEVVIGLSNDRMAEVVSGLSEGDEVIVNPRALLSDKEKAALASEGAAKGKGKGKGKGKDGKGGPPAGKGNWKKGGPPGDSNGPSA